MHPTTSNGCPLISPGWRIYLLRPARHTMTRQRMRTCTHARTDAASADEVCGRVRGASTHIPHHSTPCTHTPTTQSKEDLQGSQQSVYACSTGHIAPTSVSPSRSVKLNQYLKTWRRVANEVPSGALNTFGWYAWRKHARSKRNRQRGHNHKCQPTNQQSNQPTHRRSAV